MTTNRRFLPTLQRVVVLTPSGGQLIGIIGFIEAFDAVNRLRAATGRPPRYALELAGVEPETRSAAGPVLRTTPSAEIPGADMLVVGGGLEIDDDPRLLSEAARLACGASRVVSVCMGTFVLGALGMLNGRRCTTHWLALDRLRARFPAARVEDDAIFTEDGSIFTSAGASAGIDLALHLIRLDAGPRMALAVARALVVFAQRPGGQSQFGSAVRIQPDLGDRLRGLVSGVAHNPGADHGVEKLAASVGMSPRNFARVFLAEVGQTPAAFVARVRVEAAQRALLQGDATLDQIAQSCGFGTVETLRRTFHRVAGVSPSDYRDRFRAPHPPR
jgi:transcriptional regulator GlxA family with amidase domain